MSDVTFAWFVIEPADCGVTLMETLALRGIRQGPERAGHRAARLRAAALGRRGGVERHPAGNVSVRVTPVALEGPALLTPTV